MRLDTLWLRDFRSRPEAELELAPALTAVLGENGRGKTNLLEAIAWLATLESFRRAPTEALVRHGQAAAVVRADGEREGRRTLVEAELPCVGRPRVQVNRQRLARARDLLGVLRVVVFTPDDLALVKGGPGERRRFLDETLVALHPRYDALRRDVDHVLRQRNALLRQVQGDGRRLDESAEVTLDVWDAKLAEAGEGLARGRVRLCEKLTPTFTEAYGALADAGESRGEVRVEYRPPWLGTGLGAALAAGRRDDIRRGVTLVGPHRDDVEVVLGGLPARTHASQGEQRSLALALRLGAHAVITEVTGSAPLLLLDDVFSELDPRRSDALLAHLPSAQTVLTTASGLPAGAEPQQILRIEADVVDGGGVRSRVVPA